MDSAQGQGGSVHYRRLALMGNFDAGCLGFVILML
jgi:hypothetical protein